MPMPAGLNQLRSPAGLGKAVCVLLGAVAVADVLSIAAGSHARQLLRDAMADGFLTLDEAAADRADTLYQAAGTLRLLTFLATAVVFVIWMRRVRDNAQVFDASAHSMGPGWAIGAWFVPVGNLWLPYRVASGVWTASSPTARGGSGPTEPRGLLQAWWAMLVVAELFLRYATQRLTKAETADEIVHAYGQVEAAEALDIVAAVLAILFVRKLTAMQGERAALGTDPVARVYPAH